MKIQLLVDIDLGTETSPTGIADTFCEAIQQVAYTYGNRGSGQYIGYRGSGQYIGYMACSWRPPKEARFIRAEGKLWRSVAMLTKNENENIWEENK